MNTDLSKELYLRYYSMQNRLVHITLRDGSTISGVFVGFFRGEADWGEDYITAWHLLPEGDAHTLGIAPMGGMLGAYILQQSIAIVQFEQNGELMFFGKPSRGMKRVQRKIPGDCQRLL